MTGISRLSFFRLVQFVASSVAVFFAGTSTSVADQRVLAWFMQPQWMDPALKDSRMYGLSELGKFDKVFSSQGSAFAVEASSIDRVFATFEQPHYDEWVLKLDQILSAFSQSPELDHDLTLYFMSHGVGGHLEYYGGLQFLSYADLASTLLGHVKK